MGIPMLKIRWSWDRLIFNIGIPVPLRQHLYIETTPWSCVWYLMVDHLYNTLRLRQNGRFLPDDIFKWILLNENVWIPVEISLKFAPKGPVNKNPALVQIMAWNRPGDKPLSEPMIVYRRIYASLSLNDLSTASKAFVTLFISWRSTSYM